MIANKKVNHCAQREDGTTNCFCTRSEAANAHLRPDTRQQSMPLLKRVYSVCSDCVLKTLQSFNFNVATTVNLTTLAAAATVIGALLLPA